MKLNEAKQILNKNGFICEGIRDGDDPEFAKWLRKHFQEDMPDGCLVKSVTANDGTAIIDFRGYPRFQQLKIIWRYFDEEGNYSLYIDDKKVLTSHAYDIQDLTQQIHEFFAGSNWFYRRTHG